VTRILPIVLVLLFLSIPTQTFARSFSIRQAQATLTVNPSSLVIKVGENASAKITLQQSLIEYGNICFSVQGFPTSGFIVWMQPGCSSVEPAQSINSTLTVEATPAAAPQNFTAFVVAGSGDWTERVPISITVIPAMSAWIPWSIILAFLLVLASPVLLKKAKRYLSGNSGSAKQTPSATGSNLQ